MDGQLNAQTTKSEPLKYFPLYGRLSVLSEYTDDEASQHMHTCTLAIEHTCSMSFILIWSVFFHAPVQDIRWLGHSDTSSLYILLSVRWAGGVALPVQ